MNVDNFWVMGEFLSLSDLVRLAATNSYLYAIVKPISERMMDRVPWSITVRCDSPVNNSSYPDRQVGIRVGWFAESEDVTQRCRDGDFTVVRKGVGGEVVRDAIRYGYDAGVIICRERTSELLLPVKTVRISQSPRGEMQNRLKRRLEVCSPSRISYSLAERPSANPDPEIYSYSKYSRLEKGTTAYFGSEDAESEDKHYHHRKKRRVGATEDRVGEEIEETTSSDSEPESIDYPESSEDSDSESEM